MNASINRRSYRSAPQAELASFTENVLQRTRENPEFSFLAESLVELETCLEQYQKALAAAKNRGLVEVSAKNEARGKLVACLDLVADQLETAPELSPTRVLNAGFRANESAARTGETPPVPKIVKAVPTGNRGELKVHLNTWEGVNRQRLLHACEYSDDQGQTWKNGQYKPSQRFVLSELPPLSTLQFRFRTVAPSGKTSKWSDVVTAAVN